MSSSFPALPTDGASRGEDESRDARNSDAVSRHQDRDSELVKRARAGDPNAWARLYQNHFDRAYRYLLYLVGDGDLAEELTQETFARAMVSPLLGLSRDGLGPRWHPEQSTWTSSIGLTRLCGPDSWSR